MAPVPRRQDLDDARALAPIGRGGKALVPARAEFAPSPRIVDGRDIGRLIHQPLRRRRGRRAEHDLQSGAAEDGYRLVEPAPAEFAAPRLVARPGEFADAHVLDPDFA